MFDKFNASSAFDENGQPKPAVTKMVDTVLKVQRPLIVSMLKGLREKHPHETPDQIAKRLEKAYLRDVTVGGGAIGASAFIPGIGTATSVGLSVLAVGGYLERTAIYAQAMAELHGVHVEDPDKARLMVMAIMLGEDGSVLMNSILAHTGKTGGVSRKWGMMMGSKDSGKVFSIERTIRNMFIKKFLTRQSGALLGRALPFGVGAVVGGGANLALGKNVVKSVAESFGTLPAVFPATLDDGRAPRMSDAQAAKPQADDVIEGELEK